ncbi:undecaprenyldiphospho-muramoylpentapeptide beta-N-acetylglucosaminyltransferase [candidate division KSB1 bacterium]|nr:undecaprenyldiphospho-muramoylpentapeptide beta-N-acetylglucosaminyltransferase [candidate division KSB1 bacterium]NIR71830.1 undecaprenyldiphospho-muramoylpentapeptide beta-N-acetylglucosaminyltransferase [candidate division KSB1 bacterium]NIS25346.1 undecaprenyldiphospho-muramoylpentapeptide beta-N-acetylglucosaminyltransferase [candidate division KSB1 bacterium]NIT71816.1 undecaprenyldiphospho-muramoylpentapeptide beta-N-acetylglucosaminyltransferase [candidate division KSB1 bacterium]NIU
MAAPEPIKIIIAGGGTGGHLYPGIALAQEFQKRRKAEIMFIGTAYGIESRVLPKLPYGFKKIWMRGLQRKLSIGNMLFPLRLMVSIFQCAYLILTFRPNVVIGTGGYVSGPALMTAIVLGVPTVIQEQNSYPGLVNRLLGNRVKQMHLTYEETLKYFKKQANIYVSGNPVRSALGGQDKQMAMKKFNLQENKTTLFIFGGSQGARAINQKVMSCVDRLMSLNDLQILWATGSYDFDVIESECRRYAEDISIQPFIEDMPSAYAAADFVLCRAGASTLSEITACGLPAILVPYPYSTAGHQEFNARTLEKAGAAFVILEQSLVESVLIEAISELLTNPEKRKAMSQAACKLSKPKAAAEIVGKIETLLV